MAAMQKTWIVVADGVRASVLNYEGPNKPLVPVQGGSLEHANKPNRDIMADDRGRVFEIVDGTRSKYEYPIDPHEFEKVKFAGEIVDFLEKHSTWFERLVLVSPPKMLGELRRQLPAPIKKKIYREVDKELANVPVDQLPQHLQSVINI